MRAVPLPPVYVKAAKALDIVPVYDADLLGQRLNGYYRLSRSAADVIARHWGDGGLYAEVWGDEARKVYVRQPAYASAVRQSLKRILVSSGFTPLQERAKQYVYYGVYGWLVEGEQEEYYVALYAYRPSEAFQGRAFAFTVVEDVPVIFSTHQFAGEAEFKAWTGKLPDELARLSETAEVQVSKREASTILRKYKVCGELKSIVLHDFETMTRRYVPSLLVLGISVFRASAVVESFELAKHLTYLGARIVRGEVRLE